MSLSGSDWPGSTELPVWCRATAPLLQLLERPDTGNPDTRWVRHWAKKAGTPEAAGAPAVYRSAALAITGGVSQRYSRTIRHSESKSIDRGGTDPCRTGDDRDQSRQFDRTRKDPAARYLVPAQARRNSRSCLHRRHFEAPDPEPQPATRRPTPTLSHDSDHRRLEEWQASCVSNRRSRRALATGFFDRLPKPKSRAGC